MKWSMCKNCFVNIPCKHFSNHIEIKRYERWKRKMEICNVCMDKILELFPNLGFIPPIKIDDEVI